MRFFKLSGIMGLILFVAATAHADLTSYMWELNASARGDAANYQSEIQLRFGLSTEEYQSVQQAVNMPAEIAIVLWLSERSGRPVDDVLLLRGGSALEDWEAAAAALGIAPHSEDFEALRYGEIGWCPVGAARYGSLAEYAVADMPLN